MTYSIPIYFLHQFSACNCNAQGSSGSTCSDSGVCTCNANICGDKCDSCCTGHFGFPTCAGKYYLHNYYLHKV